MNKITQQAIASYDRYHTLLTKSLDVLDDETLTTWLADMEADLHNADIPMNERLETNAMLVGVLTVMLNRIQESAP